MVSAKLGQLSSSVKQVAGSQEKECQATDKCSARWTRCLMEITSSCPRLMVPHLLGSTLPKCSSSPWSSKCQHDQECRSFCLPIPYAHCFWKELCGRWEFSESLPRSIETSLIRALWWSYPLPCGLFEACRWARGCWAGLPWGPGHWEAWRSCKTQHGSHKHGDD